MGTLRSNPKMVFLTIYVCAYLYTSYDRYETHYVYNNILYSEQNYLGNVCSSNYINSLLNCANRFLFINQTHDTTTKRTQLITMQCPLWVLEVIYYIGKEKFRAVWHYSHIARKDLFWKCSLGRKKSPMAIVVPVKDPSWNFQQMKVAKSVCIASNPGIVKHTWHFARHS